MSAGPPPLVPSESAGLDGRVRRPVAPLMPGPELELSRIELGDLVTAWLIAQGINATAAIRRLGLEAQRASLAAQDLARALEKEPPEPYYRREAR